MDKKKTGTALIGNLVFVAVSVLYLVFAFQIRIVNIFGGTVVDSSTIPKILGVLLLVLSILSLLQSIMEMKKEMTETKEPVPESVTEEAEKLIESGELDINKALEEAQALEEEGSKDFTSILLTVGCLAVFAGLINPLGFLIASFIYMFLQVLVLTKKEERKKKLIRIIVFSLIFSAAAYFIFTKGLGLMLPTGILG